VNPKELSGNSNTPLVETIDLEKRFRLKGGLLRRETKHVKPVDNVSLAIWPGESVGLVGESGSGKTTFGKCLLRIIEPTGGRILFDSKDITHLSPAEMRPLRPSMQMVFQNPYSSLNPRMRVKDLIAEPLQLHKVGTRKVIEERVRELLLLVGLSWDHAYRLPHELSGGQRQRIALARALALNPRFVVLDEPTSALDVSVQAQVLNLVLDLQGDLGFSNLFISHDLGVIRHSCDRVALMYLGVIVELGSKEDIFDRPLHPYTQALLSSNPEPDPDHVAEEIILEGDISITAANTGACRFAPRCFAPTIERCWNEHPDLQEVEQGHLVACHLY
jgi:oligopeptide/dipeptide ABC transporter ATP-binding protein